VVAVAKFSKLQWMKSTRGADLTHAEYRVLMTMFTYADENGRNARPGVRRIADDCGVQERSVHRLLLRLREKRWLIVTERGGNKVGKGKATVYALGPGPGVGIGRPQDLDEDEDDEGKGDRRVTLTDRARVTFDAGKGDISDKTRVTAGSPHQIKEPSDHLNIIPLTSFAGSACQLRPQNWDALRTDGLMFDEWLEQELGGLSGEEYRTADGMWQSGDVHPKAILNKIIADRRQP
jgi:hypothetical protein